MSQWLLKSEPDTYSWDDLVRDGRTRWDGVRNHQAAGFLKAMQLGDQGLFYHSGADKAVVGLLSVVATAYPDPSDADGKFVAVDVAPVAALARPVSLAAMKAMPALHDFILLRQARLSVMPVTDAQWAIITSAAR
jgi:predicted RNA-binding protein with PUA-like domain